LSVAGVGNIVICVGVADVGIVLSWGLVEGLVMDVTAIQFLGLMHSRAGGDLGCTGFFGGVVCQDWEW